MKLHIWWIWLLPLAGCANQQEQALRRLNDIAEEVLRTPCAEPELSYRPVENAHVPGLVDEVETLYCPGLAASIYLSEQASRPDGMPIWLEVSGAQPTLPAFMNIGAGRDEVVAELGRPAREGPGLLRYQSGETTENVTFRLERERVSAIRWEWYID
ncbi:hypothetical protein C7I36_00230 [Zobellella taiwanensis]|uniref:Uncharacterized protein n=1 Tax=Zobellella taiwanensis TaxID=347535 RepID=A0A2P7RDL4_9GAMM|nr:hypothetical protein [Zobellella taiwanensis]PSJ48289.1 hypothetical protein C7I36_00230 [Zobellella taiwanensis]